MTIHLSSEDDLVEFYRRKFGQAYQTHEVDQGDGSECFNGDELACRYHQTPKSELSKTHKSILEQIQSPASILIICVLLLVIILMVASIIFCKRKKRRNVEDANRTMEVMSNYSSIMFPDFTVDGEERELGEPPKYDTIFMNNEGLPTYEAVVETDQLTPRAEDTTQKMVKLTTENKLIPNKAHS